MKYLRTITTASSSTTYYDTLEITLPNGPAPSYTLPEGWTRISDDACVENSHEHVPISCMWHMMTHREHNVGLMCLDCDAQWFFADDWSSPECRAERDRERQSWRYWLARQVERLLAGWKLNSIRNYKP